MMYTGKTMGIEGNKKATDALKRELKKIQDKLVTILRTNSRLLATYTRTRHLKGGTSRTRLKMRTGKLAASTKPLRVKKIKTGYAAGIKFGTSYARTHVGRKGRKTTIRPKHGNWLTIPLPAVQTKAGVTRGKDAYKITDRYFTTSGIVENAFPKMSKKGNLILFGYKKYQKGAKEGQTYGKLVPLFVLKKKVTIPTRVHPEVLIKYIDPKIKHDLEKAV